VLLNGVDELFIVDDIIGAPPHKPSSTGKVYVRKGRDSKAVRSFYPVVFGCRWVQVDNDDEVDVSEASQGADYIREFRFDNILVFAHPVIEYAVRNEDDKVAGFRVFVKIDGETVREAEVGEADTADLVFDGYVSAELFRKGFVRRV
jgi:hypothetical protein